jgi:hypothetical protein
MLKKIPPCSDLLLSLFRYYVCFDNTQHGRIVLKQAKSKDFARVDFLSTFSFVLILNRCTSLWLHFLSRITFTANSSLVLVSYASHERPSRSICTKARMPTLTQKHPTSSSNSSSLAQSDHGLVNLLFLLSIYSSYFNHGFPNSSLP